ncbi:helix-turn-helix domain-containing protein [Neobacillus pocheonensis]|uniref:Helix-turn-helix domain-containing protein n=1 Tax=Neobacillus pocheonensis TaxID=363869 RepID=A0ABT0W5P3_9BACI|nr:helix-turn-helix domain-containing protein [Neobacillus pocheonensis]
MEILTTAEMIFEHGNRHMSTKFRYLGKAEQTVISYIVSKLRKYHGSFFEKYKTIASVLEISTKTVQRAVKHAEQIGIFQVSDRFEPTLDGKMRKTTNLIQMVAYAPFEMVNGVLTIIRKVSKKAIKLVDVAKKIISNTKPAKQENKPKKSQKQTYNKPARTEKLPSWFEESNDYYADKQSVTDSRTYEEKLADIKRKFALLG